MTVDDLFYALQSRYEQLTDELYTTLFGEGYDKKKEEKRVDLKEPAIYAGERRIEVNVDGVFVGKYIINNSGLPITGEFVPSANFNPPT